MSEEKRDLNYLVESIIILSRIDVSENETMDFAYKLGQINSLSREIIYHVENKNII